MFPPELLLDGGGGDRVAMDGCFSYLGTPIGTLAHCEQVCAERLAKVRQVLTAVSTIPDVEVAFKVLKSCVNYGRVMHLLRTVPVDHRFTAFADFDDAVCAALSEITGIWPSPSQWARATRGVAAGGCGLRSADRHWPAAALASATATLDGCCQLVPAEGRVMPWREVRLSALASA